MACRLIFYCLLKIILNILTNICKISYNKESGIISILSIKQPEIVLPEGGKYKCQKFVLKKMNH